MENQNTTNESRALNIGKSIVSRSKSFLSGLKVATKNTGAKLKSNLRSINQSRKVVVAENDKQRKIEDNIKEQVARKTKEQERESKGKNESGFKNVRAAIKKPIGGLLALLAAWLVDNGKKVAQIIRVTWKKIRVYRKLITRSVNATGTIISSIGKIVVAFADNIRNFDFMDNSGRLKDATSQLDNGYKELTNSLDLLPEVWGMEEKELDRLIKALGSGESYSRATTPAFGSGAGSTITMSADEQQLTESLIAGEEGVRTKAYKDSEGIWTIGYGQTRINGRPVQPGDTISKAQALSGFRGAVAEHQQRAINQLGEDRWVELDPRSRAVLSSIAYNYGSIPERILDAAKTGSAEDIAVSMNSLYGDNRGVLKGRRKREQSILRGGTSDRLDKDFMAGGQFAGAGTGPLVMSPQPQPQPQTASPSGQSFGKSGVVDELDVATNKSKLGGLTPGQGFGVSRDGGRRHHKGLDIGTYGARGFKVALRASGRVARVSTDAGYGKFVIIEVPSMGKSFMFAHLASVYVREGSTYSGGAIGEIGSTGRSPDVHLHFEVYEGGAGGKEIDPAPYVGLLSIGRSIRKNEDRITTKPKEKATETLQKLSSNRTGAGAKKTDVVVATKETILLTS